MRIRLWACALACLCTLVATSAAAQGARAADFIVAVVNSEPITNNEIATEVQRIVNDMTQQRQVPPALATLRSQVLERLINDKAQAQFAQEMGMRIEDSQVDQAEQTVARQNQIDVAELRRRVAKDGVSTQRFREQLREQLLLTRLRDREVDSRVKVSDADVDRYMAERLAENADPLAQDINLSHILVGLPEKANADQVDGAQIKAQRLLARIQAGANFEKLVEEFSDADRSNGGQLGLRRADRYPPLFVSAVQNLRVGEVSGIVRSGAGFHILKVIERRAPTVFTRSVVQSHARHILLRPSAQLSQAQALAQLEGYKRRIEAGSTTFQSLAASNSQDGSAQNGGDLGWTNAGTFVPEFEDAMNRLAEGQISNPLVSRFGVHLIQLLERRRVDLSPRDVREWVRAQLHEKAYDDAYAIWQADVRGRAFVEMREPPQ